MPHGECTDAADEIDERIAVDVVDQRPGGAVDDDVGRFAQSVGHR